MSIVFQNGGLIDLRALKTFGVSSKDKDHYESGFDFEDLSHDPSGPFLSVADAVRGKKDANETAIKLARDAMRRDLDAHEGEQLTGEPKDRLEAAMGFIEKTLGLAFGSYQVVVVDGLGDSRLWVCEHQKIFITLELVAKGSFALTEALILALVQDRSDPTEALARCLIAVGEKVDGIAVEEEAA